MPVEDHIIYTKESLIAKLRQIRDMGWVVNRRAGNVGGIGNTLEDLLGIEENNLPIPNAAEWELKCQRSNSKSLVTLFHMEPSPTALKFVPSILLPCYGWPHQEAGRRHPSSELSFRQTISATRCSDRGFQVVVDPATERVLVSFDAAKVASHHAGWLSGVRSRGGADGLNPPPYWGFADLYHKAGTKLHNCFFVSAEVKKVNGVEHYRYVTIRKLSRFSQPRLIAAVEAGDIFVDFDARTGHNHGTKFRFKNNRLPELYEEVEDIA